VVLLMGNHDYHYLSWAGETYSGFQRWQQTPIQHLLHKALDEDLLQLCFVVDNLLFSHAGVTKTWLHSTGYKGKEPIEPFLNELFRREPSLFRLGNGVDGLPDYGSGLSPIWVRPKALMDDMIDGYAQVVGHTPQYRLTIHPQQLALIDTLGTSGEYLYIEDGQLFPFPASGGLRERG
jgi:hypothetical protein